MGLPLGAAAFRLSTKLNKLLASWPTANLGVGVDTQASFVLLHLLGQILLVGVRSKIELSKLASCKPLAHPNLLLFVSFLRNSHTLNALVILLQLHTLLEQPLLSSSIISEGLVRVVDVTKFFERLPGKDLSFLSKNWGYTITNYLVRKKNKAVEDQKIHGASESF